jgi:hypothetical protein
LAFGLIANTGSAVVNGEMLGGFVTGTFGEYLSMPISGTVLGGLSNLTANEWSRSYLSASFINTSGSVIQALNFLKSEIAGAGGDVSGPGSSTDNAIVRFNGTDGSTIANSAILISDTGDISSSSDAHFGQVTIGGVGITSLALSGAMSGAALITGMSITSIASISAGTSLAAATTVSGAGNIAGSSLTLENSSMTTAGLVSGSGVATFGALQTSAGEFTVSSTGDVDINGGAIDATAIGSSTPSSVQGTTVVAATQLQSSTATMLAGALTGAAQSNFSNTTVAQGGGYKAAMIISSSAISTSANAGLIPRMIMQGTDNTGVLSDYMIAISGGIFKVEKLTHGTWPV